MEYIAHRINTVEQLKRLPKDFGVEIDLRDFADGKIHMAHDPFEKGGDFEEYLQHYDHGTMILNIKSERIEEPVLRLLRKFGIRDYFFLDSSFPMIHALSKAGEKNIALRYSEYEGLATIVNMSGRINWIWVDCFTRMPLDKKTHDEIRAMGYRLCLVSPELQGREEEIEMYKELLKERHLKFDAICTKAYNIARWL